MSRGFYEISGRTEISLRDEFFDTLYGNGIEISKKQTGLLRIMRRDASGELIKCSCSVGASKMADKTLPCQICLGEGYLWDESYVDFYRTDPSGAGGMREKLSPPGLVNVPQRSFYIKYDDSLTEDDRVIELFLDAEGLIAEPRRRKAIYRIGAVFDFRADNGRVEYLRATGYEEKSLPLNPR